MREEAIVSTAELADHGSGKQEVGGMNRTLFTAKTCLASNTNQ